MHEQKTLLSIQNYMLCLWIQSRTNYIIVWKNTMTFFFLKMEQVSSGFSERYLLDPERFQSELEEYKKYIKSMVELIGAGERSSEFANEILDFSTQIAKVCIFVSYLWLCKKVFYQLIWIKQSYPICDNRMRVKERLNGELYFQCYSDFFTNS